MLRRHTVYGSGSVLAPKPETTRGASCLRTMVLKDSKASSGFSFGSNSRTQQDKCSRRKRLEIKQVLAHELCCVLTPAIPFVQQLEHELPVARYGSSRLRMCMAIGTTETGCVLSSRERCNRTLCRVPRTMSTKHNDRSTSLIDTSVLHAELGQLLRQPRKFAHQLNASGWLEGARELKPRLHQGLKKDLMAGLMTNDPIVYQTLSLEGSDLRSGLL